MLEPREYRMTGAISEAIYRSPILQCHARPPSLAFLRGNDIYSIKLAQTVMEGN